MKKIKLVNTLEDKFLEEKDISTNKKLEKYLLTLTKDQIIFLAERCFQIEVLKKIFNERAPVPGLYDGYSIKTDFDSYKECSKARDKYFTENKNTNFKYRNFTQSIFNAGDKKQFIDNGLNKTYSPLTTKCKTVILKDNIWKSKNISRNFEFSKENIQKTFDYIFFHLKKGVYVQIHDNELNIFLPFSNANYKNTWSNLLNAPKDFVGNQKKSKKKFNKKIDNRENLVYNYAVKHSRRDPKTAINKNLDRWYSNNCIFRNTVYSHKNEKDLRFKTDEGDRTVAYFLYTLKALCKERKVPNVEFFINYRDFPILKKDFTEPYDDLWLPEHKKVPKIKGYSYPKIPIFSQSISNKFDDLLAPMEDDMERVFQKSYLPSCGVRPYKTESIPWSKKKKTGIFRGGLTGCNVSVDDNVRLKLAYLSMFTNLFDAKITGLKKRIKKDHKSKFLNIIDENDFIFKLKKSPKFYNIEKDWTHHKVKELTTREKLTYKQQSDYKYVIHVEGNVAAFRLSIELSLNSVILKVKTPYVVWYEYKLKAYSMKTDNFKEAHFIPIKKDLSDLVSTIEWCKKNDKKCEQIAKNAKKFYDEYLTKDSVLDYWQNILCKITS